LEVFGALDVQDLKGYSTWEHWEYDEFPKGLRVTRESIRNYSSHRCMERLDDECSNRSAYICVDVFRSDISCGLDLYVLEQYGVNITEEDYYRYINPVEDSDTNSHTVRKLETHDYMVCGYGVDDDKLFFMLASRYGVIHVSPAELRLLVIFNAVGGLCIRNNLVCLTSAMQKVYGYEGFGVGQYSPESISLRLILPGYEKCNGEWYMNDSCYWFIQTPTVCELLSAGFRIDTDNGDKLTKAALARSVICSTR